MGLRLSPHHRLSPPTNTPPPLLQSMRTKHPFPTSTAHVCLPCASLLGQHGLELGVVGQHGGVVQVHQRVQLHVLAVLQATVHLGQHLKPSKSITSPPISRRRIK